MSSENKQEEILDRIEMERKKRKFDECQRILGSKEAVIDFGKFGKKYKSLLDELNKGFIVHGMIEPYKEQGFIYPETSREKRIFIDALNELNFFFIDCANAIELQEKK